MKIKYEFATETVEIEVTEEWADVIKELDRQEYNSNHRETRRHISLNTGMDRSDWLRSIESDPYCQYETNVQARRIRKAVSRLTSDQKHLIQKRFLEEMSAEDYAAECNVNSESVYQRTQTIRRQLIKILESDSSEEI